jgi:hypothetical protein
VGTVGTVELPDPEETEPGRGDRDRDDEGSRVPSARRRSRRVPELVDLSHSNPIGTAAGRETRTSSRPDASMLHDVVGFGVQAGWYGSPEK